ncbi:hypothetical protein GCM10016272_01680 [Psychrobacter glaciei]|uniref:Uncharacterized protein n=1 Tax=Psychrobacter glaciei TaxID=619771 RepID=A0ABQ3GLQ6_9GAMM|nr:hypothetical protein [Psychrobacter glaciei]GHD25624.1 hypothetical protein GCM10016272_01680 [Psychrobacter glaciei]
MPNNQQPQGVTKTVNNPVANDTGKYIVDFDVIEDDGIATASHLAIFISDSTARTNIDVIFNPALLRTRFDSVYVEAVTSTATNLNIYTLLNPEHLADYTTAPKRTLAIAEDKSELFTIKKLGDVIVFDGADIDRIQTMVTPENGSGTMPPTDSGSGDLPPPRDNTST